MSYTENFESYSVGQTLPFGQLTADSNTFIASVIAGDAIGAGSKSFQLFSECIWNDGFTYLHFFTAFAYKAQSTGSPIKITNHQSVNTYGFVEIRINFDSTVSLLVAGSVVATSADPYHYLEWNFYDIDINVSSDLSGNVIIAINHFYINGVSVYSGTTTTTKNISTLPTGVAQVNWMILGGGSNGVNWFDDLTVMATPIGSSGNLRATQGFAEFLELLDSASIRITQGLAEVLLRPTTAQIRVTQGFIELIISRSAVTGAGWQVKEC